MRVGVIVDARQDAWKLSEWGQLAESYGIHCLWLSSLSNSKDPFVNLSLLAANTKTMALGPIAVSPFDLHPLMMTMSLMTLNEIAKGRAVIVVGGGGVVARNIGVDLSNFKKVKRIASTRECVEIIKQIASGKKVTYTGKRFRIRSFQSNWAPNPGPIVYVGANKPKMLKMASKVSDGIMMTDIPPGYVDPIVSQIQDRLTGARRESANFRINNFYAWHVKDDYQDALQEAKRHLVTRGAGRPEIAKAIGLTDEERDLYRSNVPSLLKYLREGIPPKEIPEDLLTRISEGITLVGQTNKLDDCIETLHQFKRKGLNEIALRIYGDATSSIKVIGEKIVPELQ